MNIPKSVRSEALKLYQKFKKKEFPEDTWLTLFDSYGNPFDVNFWKDSNPHVTIYYAEEIDGIIETDTARFERIK